MRTEEEVIDRLRNYEKNLEYCRNAQRKDIIKPALIELSWILGEESNYKAQIKK